MSMRIVLAISLGLAAGHVAAQGNIEAGKQKSLPCSACHGVDGNGTGIPMYPVIAGQYADYLSKALHEYKSGARSNVIMAGMTSALSEQDIADLAAYFAAQQGPLTELIVTNADQANAPQQ